MALGEFELIAWMKAFLEAQRAGGGAGGGGSAGAGADPRVALGIGDDCAVLRLGPEVLITTDMLMDGRHFLLEEQGAEAVGYKAFAVNLSDIAAMGGWPLAAVVSVALPRGRAVEAAKGLLAGMAPLIARWNVALIGGDTNAWDGPLVISVTMLGSPPAGGALTRSGAVAGDVIAVTGPLGGSLVNGRHLRPQPRIDEIRDILRRVRPHALIDLSDGLAGDLSHILQASGGLGADLDPDRLPIHPDAYDAARRDGRPPWEHALRDGEDFELCLTLARADWERLEALPVPNVAIIPVGTVAAAPGIRLLTNPPTTIRPGGFDHLAPTPES